MIRLIQGMSLPYAGRLLINRRKFSLDIEACTDTVVFCFLLSSATYHLPGTEPWRGGLFRHHRKSCI